MSLYDIRKYCSRVSLTRHLKAYYLSILPALSATSQPTITNTLETHTHTIFHTQSLTCRISTHNHFTFHHQTSQGAIVYHLRIAVAVSKPFFHKEHFTQRPITSCHHYTCHHYLISIPCKNCCKVRRAHAQANITLLHTPAIYSHIFHSK